MVHPAFYQPEKFILTYLEYNKWEETRCRNPDKHFTGLWKQLLKTQQRVNSLLQDAVGKFNSLVGRFSHPIKALGWILNSHC